MNKLKRYFYCNSFHNRLMEECEVERVFVFNGVGCGDYYTDYNKKPVTGENYIKEQVFK